MMESSSCYVLKDDFSRRRKRKRRPVVLVVAVVVAASSWMIVGIIGACTECTNIPLAAIPSLEGHEGGLRRPAKVLSERYLEEDVQNDYGDGGEYQDNENNEQPNQEEEEGLEDEEDAIGENIHGEGLQRPTAKVLSTGRRLEEEVQENDYGDGGEYQEEDNEQQPNQEEDGLEEEEDAIGENNSLDHDDRPDFVDDFYAFPEDEVLTLFPLTHRDVLCFSLASVCVILAAGAGVGGGGMVLPLYLLVWEMPTSLASPLAAVTVLGGALSVTLVNAGRRHPLADRPLMDWDLLLVMQPVILVGTIIGTMMSQVLSEQVLVVLIVLLLGFTAHRTLRKASKMKRAEDEYMEKRKAINQEEESLDYETIIKQQDTPRHESDGGCLCPNPSSPPDTIASSSSSLSSSIQSNQQRDPLHHLALTEQEKTEIRILNPDYVTMLTVDLIVDEKYTSTNKIIAVVCMCAVTVFLNTMLGGGAFYSPWGIRCGGMVFWLVHVIWFSFLFAFSWAAHTYVVNKHEIKELTNYDFVHGDVKWDARSAIMYPFFFLVAGLAAGMFGIGGGLVTVPLMLVMGIHPEVATATSSCMILFTSITSTASYAVFGLIHWGYAAACVLVGFFASLIGKKIMYQAKKYNIDGVKYVRNSYIAYAVGGVLLLSGLLLTINYIFIIEGFEEDDELGGICYNSRI